MNDKKQRTILLLIPTTFSARLILRSDVLRFLKEEGYKIVIVSPHATEKYFINEFSDKNIFIRELKVRRNRLSFYFEDFYRYNYCKSRQTTTLVEFYEKYRTEYTVRRWFYEFLNKVLLSNKIWKIVGDYLSKKESGNIFKEFNIDLIVYPGAHSGGFYLCWEAQRLKIPMLYVVESWDHLTSKAYFSKKPDKVIVWNEVNKKEAIKYIGCKEKDVYVAGVPYFDSWVNIGDISNRQDYFLRMGLDPNRKLLFLGGPGKGVIELDEVVRVLAEAIEKNLFIYPCQLLIRPHPVIYAMPGKGKGTKEDLERYRMLSRYIFIDKPKILSKSVRVDIPADEYKHLAETLYHTDVTVNFFSTLMIESCVVNTPVINVAFSGPEYNDNNTLRKFKEREHIRNILKTGGVRVAHSPKELIEGINAYLKNPSLDEQARKQVVKEQCFKLDGKSSYRTSKCISLYAKGKWILNQY